MTARARVAEARRVLMIAAGVVAVAWGVAAFAGGVLAFRLLGEPAVSAILTAALGAGAVALALWRRRRVLHPARVALWLEEMRPDLRYALVSASEPGGERLERATQHLWRDLSASSLVAQPALHTLAVPLAIALVFTAALPLAERSEVQAAIARVTTAGRASFGERLSPLTARVTPPAYAGTPTRTLSEPQTIAALPGSRVEIRGAGDATGIHIEVAGRSYGVANSPWRATFGIPPTPSVLRISDSTARRERIIVLVPTSDSVPEVTLEIPAADSTFRSAPSSVVVRARARDDYGLAELRVEYTITSGEGEVFAAREGVAARTRSRGRTAVADARLGGRALRIGPGDVISLRAVAVDRNDVTGPGVGFSDTRTLRIARRDEYDSLAVEVAAPFIGDTALISQRMLLRRTEALVRQLPALVRDTVVGRSMVLAYDQERLRDRVHDLIYPQHTHPPGEHPGMEGEPEDTEEPAPPVNPDLKSAYDAMWAAARELRVAAPDSSIPHMRAALAALDRARTTNRYYLRSGAPRVVVDVGRVRLTGKEKGESSARSPRAAMEKSFASIIDRLGRAARLARRAPSDATNELAILRAESITSRPRFAEALAVAIDDIVRRRDPAGALAAARRALDAVPAAGRGIPAWTGW